MGLARLVGKLLAGYLTSPSRAPYANFPTDPGLLARSVMAGDVLLVEGRQRVSTAIKYLTQSTWSHAALCIGNMPGKNGGTAPCFVEADAVEGVRLVGIGEFAALHTRICRPVGLTDDDRAALVRFALDRVGDSYDLANVIDLARYLFPTPPVPARWRRNMIALGSGEPSKAICSTLVAQAFQSIHYPILPEITHEMADDPQCRDCVKAIMHVRHHSLFTPRDFDVSPYFRIVKPTVEFGFDYHRVIWSGSPQHLAGSVA